MRCKTCPVSVWEGSFWYEQMYIFTPHTPHFHVWVLFLNCLWESKKRKTWTKYFIGCVYKGVLFYKRPESRTSANMVYDQILRLSGICAILAITFDLSRWVVAAHVSISLLKVFLLSRLPLAPFTTHAGHVCVHVSDAYPPIRRQRLCLTTSSFVTFFSFCLVSWPVHGAVLWMCVWTKGRLKTLTRS